MRPGRTRRDEPREKTTFATGGSQTGIRRGSASAFRLVGGWPGWRQVPASIEHGCDVVDADAFLRDAQIVVADGGEHGLGRHQEGGPQPHHDDRQPMDENDIAGGKQPDAKAGCQPEADADCEYAQQENGDEREDPPAVAPSQFGAAPQAGDSARPFDDGDRDDHPPHRIEDDSGDYEGDKGENEEKTGQEGGADRGSPLRQATPEELAEADAASTQLLHGRKRNGGG